MIYTTNAIERLHMQLRKIIKTRWHFPSDEAATKLLWPAPRNILTDVGVRQEFCQFISVNFAWFFPTACRHSQFRDCTIRQQLELHVSKIVTVTITTAALIAGPPVVPNAERHR